MRLEDGLTQTGWQGLGVLVNWQFVVGGDDQTCELDFNFSGLIGKTPDLSGDLGFDSRLKFNLCTIFQCGCFTLIILEVMDECYTF